MKPQPGKCCITCEHGIRDDECSFWETVCDNTGMTNSSYDVCGSYHRDEKWPVYNDAFGPEDKEFELE
jgi:hypothetical protein